MTEAATIQRRPLAGEPHGWAASVHPVLRRIYAGRGVLTPEQAERRLARLLSPQLLGGMASAVTLLADTIDRSGDIVIAGDYDCDGATGTAVAMLGLRLLGAPRVNFVMPNRFVHGYGLSPALVASLVQPPTLILTVDNGVASVDGVAEAQRRGSRVIITDHHLPGEQLPAADALVNPNLTGDAFPSKALAGVGVMFYLLLALRTYLRERGDYRHHPEPDLASLLDLVALGTVADLVPLDFNNRILVEAGLKRIRRGQGRPGIHALLELAKRDASSVGASDLGFAVAPRLNAAGRLDDMRLGVLCLLSEDAAGARRYAERLDAINRERRALQQTMVGEAEYLTGGLDFDATTVGVTLYDPGWHVGIVGLVASRLKDRLHRPVVAFAPAEDEPGMLRGSARSIHGFHIRDALALLDARHPGLLSKFGGHAMAAGLSLRQADYPLFATAFDQLARSSLSAEHLQAAIHTDGELPAGEVTLDLAMQLRDGGPWGQGFPEPLFDNTFECLNFRVMSGVHLRLALRDPRDGAELEAVMFNAYTGQPPPKRLHAVYELAVNAWQGIARPQLVLRQFSPV